MHNFASDLSILLSLNGLITLFTLTILEIILGIDNIIFISIAVDKLPREQQSKARTIGLLLALVVRTILLFFVGYIASLKEPFAHIGAYGISGKALILLGGGLFLLIKTNRLQHVLKITVNFLSSIENAVIEKQKYSYLYISAAYLPTTTFKEKQLNYKKF